MVMLEKVIAPVRWEMKRNFAVTVSPGRRVGNSTRSGLCSRLPETLRGFRLILTRLATVCEVLSRVTKASYGSPALTVRGWEKAKLNLGLLTITLPAALPSTSTGPAANPSSFAFNFRSITCSPSCSPSTRNSPCPPCPGRSRPTSSGVPGWPSTPAAWMEITLRISALGPIRAKRTGSSPGAVKVPATRSGPGGRISSAVMSLTLSPLAPGAAFSVKICTLKN